MKRGVEDTKLEAILTFCFLLSLTASKIRKFVTRKLYWSHLLQGPGYQSSIYPGKVKILLC